MVAVLGDTDLRVCSAKICEPLEIIDLLNKNFSSNRTETLISVLTSMLPKLLVAIDEMPNFIDELETLFARFEHIGSETRIPEAHKPSLLLTSMGNYSAW